MFMKITANSLLFTKLSSLMKFIKDLNWRNHIIFENKIVDNTGKVLIEKGILVKPGALTRLETMHGSYKPYFKIKVTNELVTEIRNYLAVEIVIQLDAPENNFIKHLYASANSNYKSLIQQALKSRKLILGLYNFHTNKHPFFCHVSALGLLCLGLVIQNPADIKMIRSYAFLAGLVCDLVHARSDAWRQVVGDYEFMKATAIKASNFAATLGIPAEIVSAIQNYAIEPGKPKAEQDINFTNDILFGREEDSVEKNKANDDELKNIDKKAIKMLIELLRLSKFIQQTTIQIKNNALFAEELVYAIAYNSSKGYFNNDLMNTIISSFTQYEKNARNLIKIGGIENKCLLNDQALAYSKPSPSQILCVGKHYDCPNIISGWEMNVIAPDSSIGWLGKVLAKGSYPKCKLEHELAALLLKN